VTIKTQCSVASSVRRGGRVPAICRDIRVGPFARLISAISIKVVMRSSAGFARRNSISPRSRRTPPCGAGGSKILDFEGTLADQAAADHSRKAVRQPGRGRSMHGGRESLAGRSMSRQSTCGHESDLISAPIGSSTRAPRAYSVESRLGGRNVKILHLLMGEPAADGC